MDQTQPNTNAPPDEPLPLIVRGRGQTEPPPPFDGDDDVIKLPECPDCEGRGWYLIEPFRTGGTNGAGGLGNLTQCMTCKTSYAYFQAHGCLPPSVVADIKIAAER